MVKHPRSRESGSTCASRAALRSTSPETRPIACWSGMSLLVDRIDEVAREEIAHIVEATVDALLIGGRLGVVTDESAVPKTAPPAPERPKGVSLDVGLGYATQMWSDSSQPFLHGPAIFVGMAGRAGTVRPGVW